MFEIFLFAKKNSIMENSDIGMAEKLKFGTTIVTFC